jgi:hypothetical protein
MRASFCLALLCAACAAPGDRAPPAPGAVSPACEVRAANPALAGLVSSSPHILVGTPAPSRERFRAAATHDPPEYFEFPVTGVEVLKGPLTTDRLTVRNFPGDGYGEPEDETILGASGIRSLLFLVEGGGRPGELYFAGRDKAALQPATSINLAAAREEIARQERIAVRWWAPPNLPHFDKVRELVEALVAVARLEGGRDFKLKAQQRIFREFEELGPAAAPAIVAHMDDRRPLAIGQISLRNPNPNGWEGILHYGPKVVVDALSVILTQVTGRLFLVIHNGGTEEQRRAVLIAWRVHMHDIACYGAS